MKSVKIKTDEAFIQQLQTEVREPLYNSTKKEIVKSPNEHNKKLQP